MGYIKLLLAAAGTLLVVLAALVSAAPSWALFGIGSPQSSLQSASSVPGDENWDPRFVGPPGISHLPGNSLDVRAVALSGNTAYAGGNFTNIATGTVNNIASWDATTNNWSALISGTVDGVDGFVNAIAISGTDVYAGGSFASAGGSPANNIAKWDGVRWTALMSGTANGVGSTVDAIAVRGGEIVASGFFQTAGGSPANKIARWDGLRWSPLLSGTQDGVLGGGTAEAFALAISGTDVIAGGNFFTAGGVSAMRIARWDGIQWSPILSGTANGVSSTVHSLVMSGTEVIAGGEFMRAGGSIVNYIARWNGVRWSGFGSGTAFAVNSVVMSGTDVYAGGSFNLAGGSPANGVAKWSGAWSALPPAGVNGVSGSNANVLALAASAGLGLVAGGDFETAGGIDALKIARFRAGTGWTPLGAQVSNGLVGTGFADVKALARRGNDVIAGGSFYSAGQTTAHNVAKLNGATWSPLVSGTNEGVSGTVYALTVSGTEVIVGGSFGLAAGLPVSNVARWDGVRWAGLFSGTANGVNGDVYALASDGVNVYAGGSFNLASGQPVSNVAKWDGVRWSPLFSGTNQGVDGAVYALHIDGSDVYAGGSFDHAGGMSATNIAKWDGLRWSALMSGTDVFGVGNPGGGNRVNAIAVALNGVYAGGQFFQVGNQIVNNMALWTGIGWSPLMSGTQNGPGGEVKSIKLGQTVADVTLGGAFVIGPGTVSNIARWDGQRFGRLGAGTDLQVNAVVLSDTETYAGGSFFLAGGKSSFHIGRYTEPPPPPPSESISTPTRTPTPTSTSTPTPTPTPTVTATPTPVGGKIINLPTSPVNYAADW